MRFSCFRRTHYKSVHGYIDLTAAHYESLHDQVLNLLFRDPNIDLVLQILGSTAFIDQTLIVKEISKAYESQTGIRNPQMTAASFNKILSKVLPTFFLL